MLLLLAELGVPYHYCLQSWVCHAPTACRAGCAPTPSHTTPVHVTQCIKPASTYGLTKTLTFIVTFHVLLEFAPSVKAATAVLMFA